MKQRRKSPAVVINPLVVDLSHHNDVADFGAVEAGGIAGIIHKATEGVGFTDKLYADRRSRALGVGLLWGAYHFLRPVSIAAQVDFFLKVAAPDSTTLLALDHEDKRVALIDAKEFLLRVEDAVGRKPVLYSGSVIKEQLGSRIEGFLATHRLWLAQYGPRPVTPRNWPSAWLWQFTGDGLGPKPHSVPGIVDSGIDINSYEGDVAKLAAEWSGPTTVEPPTA
jgi:GH25 family lysozyme M1 (1,4-beta-N-acetylmuramidase)